MPGPLTASELQAGESISVGDVRLIPFMRSSRLTFPGGLFRLFWNRPASVLLVSPDGTEQVIPVPDLTRRIQWFFYAFGLAGTVLIWLVNRQKKQASTEP